MTTVIFDGKHLASDSQRTRTVGNVPVSKFYKGAKYKKLKTGRYAGKYVAKAGREEVTAAMIRALEDNVHLYEVQISRDPLEHGSLMLVDMRTSEVLVIDSDDMNIREMRVPAAIGSGADLALGASLAGKSAVEAIKIAATRDDGTGGKVYALSRRAVLRHRKGGISTKQIRSSKGRRRNRKG